jgi:cystathionine gamma-synthase
MRTLDLRVNAQSRSALTLARRIRSNAALSCVLYPGLPDHPGHDLARRQMKGGFGGMLSLRIKAGEQAAIQVAANVSLWKRATSLGGVESLIEHRSSIEGRDSPCPADLLRLSVGLEDVDDLCTDLERALALVARDGPATG